MLKLICHILICILVSNVTALGQKKYEPDNHRSIVLTTKDVIIQCVVNSKKKVKPMIDRQYHWYGNDKINITQGGYSHFLLDGAYTEFYYPDRLLLCKGSFSSGLKTGRWLYWHKNGKLIESVNWQKGRISGTRKIYNENGTMLHCYHYKKSVLISDCCATDNKDKENVNTAEGNTSLLNRFKNLFKKRDARS